MAALRQRQTIVQGQGSVANRFAWMILMAWLGIGWIRYEREVRNKEVRCVIDTGWEVRIFLYSCVGIRAGRFICSVLTLEVALSREVHSWCSRTLDYERAGVYGRSVAMDHERAGRSIALDHERVGLWEHDNP